MQTKKSYVMKSGIDASTLTFTLQCITSHKTSGSIALLTIHTAVSVTKVVLVLLVVLAVASVGSAGGDGSKSERMSNAGRTGAEAVFESPAAASRARRAAPRGLASERIKFSQYWVSVHPNCVGVGVGVGVGGGGAE